MGGHTLHHSERDNAEYDPASSRLLLSAIAAYWNQVALRERGTKNRVNGELKKYEIKKRKMCGYAMGEPKQIEYSKETNGECQSVVLISICRHRKTPRTQFRVFNVCFQSSQE
ncbi:hypothetical protein C0Q44_02860 [Paenibacillus sp. PCH8]|uniref:hypothetical protein n=1 Tax=Paenibacillus sp. PCH8 TaxID=2066524 RepID=UPI000CF917F2|nr:hypothetical protein [Paenibacillus sp. PCH8]PQP83646.1 hypothetical protein C0Q44_02860 [Paenibacillus sp. PCH8]